ncbi:MAG TPA: hypothetical protein VD932_02480 [Aquabacterium sp.]|nr:hypothetical protein [Aquabacterium sp.]
MAKAGRKHMGESKASVRRIEAKEKQFKALELRRGGADYRQIANALGYAHPSGAHKAVMSAMHEVIREPAEEVRKIELDRLDKLLLSVWNRATSGDMEAFDRVMKVMAMRARLEGINAPEKIAPTTPDGQALFDWSLLAKHMEQAAPDTISEEIERHLRKEPTDGGEDPA